MHLQKFQGREQKMMMPIFTTLPTIPPDITAKIFLMIGFIFVACLNGDAKILVVIDFRQSA
jgi:hypothetical protein